MLAFLLGVFVTLVSELLVISAALLYLWLKLPRKRLHAVEVVFYIGGMRVHKMNLRVDQSLPMSVAFVDKKGNPAPVNGVPEWSLTDPSLGDLQPADDGMSCKLVPKGPLGKCQVQVSANADMDPSGPAHPILGTLDMQFIAAEAVGVNISAGDPE